MQTSYHEKRETFNYCRLLMALPFLPSEYIQRSFQELQNRETATPMQQLLTYMETNWIVSNQFPIPSWSVFRRPFRTNNDVEGWHNKLNQNVSAGGLNLYELINRLNHEATDVALVCQFVEEEQMTRLQRTKYKQLHDKIITLWDRFDNREITVKSLLKNCSYLNGP